VCSRSYDDVLTAESAKPCNEAGEYLPPYTRSPSLLTHAALDAAGTPDSWNFVTAQSSAGLIDKALDLRAVSVVEFGGAAPWNNSRELYASIDAIKLSESPWETHTIRY
jgi:hypothetical protein